MKLIGKLQVSFLLVLSFLDIGANLPDLIFRGIYRDVKVHADDMLSVLKRSASVGLSDIIATSTTLEDYHANSDIIKEFCGVPDVPRLFTTIGVHPCSTQDIYNQCAGNDDVIREYFESINSIAEQQPRGLAAIGECGVDYARLFRSPKELQLSFFHRHFDHLPTHRMPMFLHMRDCATDFLHVLQRNRDRFVGGVVHSFTGSVLEAKEIVDFHENVFIGLNGCSLREPMGIDVARALPLDRIVIESDAPHCEMRKSHASGHYLEDFSWPVAKPLDKSKHSPDNPVRGRNEPTEARRVLYALSKIKEIPESELANIIYENTLRLFPACA